MVPVVMLMIFVSISLVPWPVASSVGVMVKWFSAHSLQNIDYAFIFLSFHL